MVMAGITCMMRDSSASASTTRHYSQAKLTLEQRVAYQRAIEEIYWQHRLWPKENPNSKPSLLEEIMPLSEIQAKVEDSLRKSKTLEDYWQRPIGGEQLQAEMGRMASQTQQPEVLREIFEALGNDPYVIAECLARPALAERLIRNRYAYDERFHGKLKRQAEADLSGHCHIEAMRPGSGKYTAVRWVRQQTAEYRSAPGRCESEIELNREEWNALVKKLKRELTIEPAESPVEESRTARQPQQAEEQIGPVRAGEMSRLQEDEEKYYVKELITADRKHLKVATVEWRKEPFDSWWERVRQGLGETEETAGYDYKHVEIRSVAVTTNPDPLAATPILSGRFRHTAVWTGSEMIIWGGTDNSTLYNTGARYNPSTSSWTATSTTGAVPSPRALHTAVWTGTEMIVWGGDDPGGFASTGGRYNPSTNSWTATSTTGA
ncbi:MAG: hypothetical protein V7641_47, partial [Blastocatellia bacterium]